MSNRKFPFHLSSFHPDDDSLLIFIAIIINPFSRQKNFYDFPTINLFCNYHCIYKVLHIDHTALYLDMKFNCIFILCVFGGSIYCSYLQNVVCSYVEITLVVFQPCKIDKIIIHKITNFVEFLQNSSLKLRFYLITVATCNGGNTLSAIIEDTVV